MLVNLRSLTQSTLAGPAKKIASLLPCIFLMSHGHVALAQQTIDLRVSAIVPPRLCNLGERCMPAAANAVTRVVVEGDVIRYTGSQPVVTRDNGVMTILF